MSKDQSKNVRMSLSKTQIQEGIGAELFSLCQGITADGKVSKAEIVALGEWLDSHKAAPLPAIALLTETLTRIVADGRVTRDEQRELLEAIEKVLPPDTRKDAKAAWKAVEAKRAAELKATQQSQRRQELEREMRRSPEDEFDFMVAGVSIDDRHRIIERSLSVGSRVRLLPEPDNPQDDCAVIVTLTDGRMIGYVPRNDSEDVTGCIEDGGYYVASVKKILTGGRLPVPVIVVEFYRPDQYNDIFDLSPDACPKPQPVVRRASTTESSDAPWWKFW